MHQDAESGLEIRRNPWIRGGLSSSIDKPIPRVHVPTPYDHDIQEPPTVRHPQRPGSAARRMSWRLVRNEHASTKPDLIPVVEDSVNLRRGIPILRILEVRRSAGFDYRHVA